VAHILRQNVCVVGKTHVGGLVHRDIKSANIHPGPARTRLRFRQVLDFGLLKPIADRSIEQSLNTQAGLLSGTPG
jgi:serine/threonine protein kinase